MRNSYDRNISSLNGKKPHNENIFFEYKFIFIE